MKKNKEFKKTKLKIVHKKRLTVIAGILVVIVVVSVVAVKANLSSSDDTNSTYRETTVEEGPLTVGIEESGSVDIGTIDQTFELDLSAYVSSSSSSSSSTSGGGDAFSQMMSMMSGQSGSSSSDSSTLEISAVDVTVGQTVAVGDTLYELTDDSVMDIRDQMESDVESAQADLDSIIADNSISKVSAQNTYNTAIAYGSYAQTEYDTTVQDLQDTIDDLQEQIEAYQNDLETKQNELTDLQTQYDDVKATADAFAYSVNTMDPYDDTINYVSFVSSMRSSQSTVDDLDDEIDSKEDDIEDDQDTLADLQTQLGEAQRKLATGTLDAQEQYDEYMLEYNTAQETYDVSIASLELTQKEQEETYEDSQNKLTEFDNNISDGAVISEYAGTITDVPLATGDTITTSTTLLTLFDADDTTITVDVDESDMDSLELGSVANVTFTAYPDETFTGSITEIDEGETDSSGNITYPVTVTLDGDTSGLFQDMTGELTFVTKETDDVVYVSNRAINRDGTRSYVKMRDDDGNIVEQDVTTGFSDGENVEITDGLSAGDVVLIESAVSGS